MELDVILNTGRTISQGQNVENKMSVSYMEATAQSELNPADMEILGNPLTVEVTTDFGAVVVKAVVSDRNPAGLIFIPYGPWANQLTDPDTAGCGMPGLKGIPAKVKATGKHVKPLQLLLEGGK